MFAVRCSKSLLNACFYSFSDIELPSKAVASASKNDFELKGFQFDALKETTRPAQIVRVGIIQNKIVVPTSEPIIKQVISMLTIQFCGS